jgi:hypothetical protein
VTWTLKPKGKSTIKSTQIYRFEVDSAGRATTPTRIKGGVFNRVAGDYLAASPDGSQVALEVTPPNRNGVLYTGSLPSGIFVVNTKTGKRAFWRIGPHGPGKVGFAGDDDISFTQNGSELVVLEGLCQRSRHHSNCRPFGPTEVRAYGPVDQGGSLQGGRVLLRRSFGEPENGIIDALITPDGTALNSVILHCPKRGVCTVTVERIGLTAGQGSKVLYKVHAGSRAFSIDFRSWDSDPTGQFFLINAADHPGSGWVNGWIDHGRLVKLAPAHYDGAEVW